MKLNRHRQAKILGIDSFISVCLSRRVINPEVGHFEGFEHKQCH